jgi:hypothetical protein
MIQNKVVSGFEQRVRDVIARIALRSPIKDAEGYFSKSYYANTIDHDQVADFHTLANDAFEFIDQHFGKDLFGLRFEWGFVDRDGEQVKALRPRGNFGKAVSLLQYLVSKNLTLEPRKPLPLSDEERALRAKVVQRVSRAVALSMHNQEDGDALAPDKRVNYRPNVPPDTKLAAYGPELWQILLDLLLIIQIPGREFVNHAKSRDGWQNKKGRQLAVYKNIARTLAHDLFARQRGLQWTIKQPVS